MRRERLYLVDIVKAADTVAEFLAGASRESFLASDLVRSAVMYQLVIIGEAAAHVGPETRAAHRGIPWVDIVGFRNFAVHAYFGTDWDIAWNAANFDVPELRERIAVVVAALPPDE